MVKYIGIVACSAEGAALCYRTICVEGTKIMGRHAHPEISMHTYPLSEYMKYINVGDWHNVAKLMLSSAEKLVAIGADFLICPDNTIHQAFSLVIKKSPRPWLHIAEEVRNEALRCGYKKLGILGTRFLMEGPVYPEKLSGTGIEYIVPEKDEREKINMIIFDELVYGRFTNESRNYFSRVINSFKKKGCDAVVLGCTEIPLIVTAESSSLPLLDSTRILAKKALEYALK